MTLELKFDNGVSYSLTIPRGLFNCNTKEYIIKVFKEWLEEGAYKDKGEIKNL